ncbi:MULTISPECIES: pyridoxamine 5'-phosphate oxidase family protein [Bacillaceae]|uniref:pyridoxamine 5'-phosphate oxidase family protein n=1 Tax=Bacillaceae TaxID=186817 RepID=UPI001C56EF99|nr:pyridoxamine 5'-phosphate oxidase family protein [Rossellomorea sp. YZS02]MBW3111712.1 pyridoxamine 5'-phosphate oxidase family protein [Bacillus sp. MCCB 382]MDX8342154.1 pyridoxamine 5'-phosphate oxidase family protein [Rossellomorea sp. YZS02]
MNIITGKRHFNLDEFLKKPLFAHLSTLSKEGPRESPVWFYWENEHIYIIGTPPSDSFPGRIKENPSCAIGIVDLDHTTGKVLHAGFRGKATVEPFDQKIGKKLLERYLGPDEERWDSRFQGLGNSNVLIKFVPETVVVRDQSFAPSI